MSSDLNSDFARNKFLSSVSQTLSYSATSFKSCTCQRQLYSNEWYLSERLVYYQLCYSQLSQTMICCLEGALYKLHRYIKHYRLSLHSLASVHESKWPSQSLLSI